MSDRGCEFGVAVLFAKGWRDLEGPESVDEGLHLAVPNTVGTPKDIVFAGS
jgi:hypothetical protein